MQFNAEQLEKDALIPEGVYKFKVIYANERTSSSGNQMINLKLEIWVENRGIHLFDALILIPKMFWKIKHFCKSTGCAELIEKGEIWAGDCEGKQGHVSIGHFKNNQNGEFEAKVKDYLELETVAVDPMIPVLDKEDLPF